MAQCQRISCSVTSCLYNERKEHLCSLDAIQVGASPGDSGSPKEETLCASFESSSQRGK